MDSVVPNVEDILAHLRGIHDAMLEGRESGVAVNRRAFVAFTGEIDAALGGRAFTDADPAEWRRVLVSFTAPYEKRRRFVNFLDPALMERPYVFDLLAPAELASLPADDWQAVRAFLAALVAQAEDDANFTRIQDFGARVMEHGIAFVFAYLYARQCGS